MFINLNYFAAKSDTMTPEEVAHFKRQIMNQIVQAKIRIYEFPEDELSGSNGVKEDEHERRENRKMKERVPFAIVGSNCMIENADGKKVRGRKYPWGIVDVSSTLFFSQKFREINVVNFSFTDRKYGTL